MKWVALLLLFVGSSVSRAAAQDTDADFSLDRVISRVLYANPAVKAAEASYTAARGRLLTQRPPLADPIFVVDYDLISKPLKFGGFGERTFGVVQPLELPLKWLSRNKIAGKEARVAEMNFELVKLVIATVARKAYGQALTRQREKELADDNLVLAQDFLQKARVRFEAGDVRRIEVLRAAIEVAAAELDTVQADKNLLLAGTNLNLLMVREAHAPLNLTDSLTFAPVEYDMVSLKALMLERHPRVRAENYAVAGSRSLVRLAQMQYLPDVDLGIYRRTFRDAASSWEASLAFRVPLWSFFRQRGDVQQAKASLALVRAERVSVRNGLVFALESAHHELEVADKRVRMYTENLLEAAEEVYRIASRSYVEGEASYLEVLEAQRVLRTTRTEYTQALFEYQSALADLEQAVGGPLTSTDG